MVDNKEIFLHAEDLTLAPIQEQLENLNKLGKAMKKMFRSRSGETTPDKDEETPADKGQGES